MRQHHICACSSVSPSSFSSWVFPVTETFWKEFIVFVISPQCLVTTPAMYEHAPSPSSAPCSMERSPSPSRDTFLMSLYPHTFTHTTGLSLQRSGAGSSYCSCDFNFLCPACTSPPHIPTLPSQRNRSLPGLGFMPSIKQAVKRCVLALRGPWLQNS